MGCRANSHPEGVVPRFGAGARRTSLRTPSRGMERNPQRITSLAAAQGSRTRLKRTVSPILRPRGNPDIRGPDSVLVPELRGDSDRTRLSASSRKTTVGPASKRRADCRVKQDYSSAKVVSACTTAGKPWYTRTRWTIRRGERLGGWARHRRTADDRIESALDLCYHRCRDGGGTCIRDDLRAALR